MGPSSIDQVSILASTLKMALELILGSSIHHSTFSAVSSPARWSFSFIVGPLHYQSQLCIIIYISNIQRTKKYSAVMYYLLSDLLWLLSDRVS